ncbi:MAG: YhcH/YjgK/YiaL family protein [Planctomycetaceae bacterium]|nr:YhcH/YjgK/YiaL family protein [Planctomycetaceae bacterium]
MILDHLSRAARYRAVSPGIAKAFDFLRTLDVAKLVDGRNAIDGDRAFAMLNRYRTKPPAEAVWESHRKYIDVQYVVSGEEWMGYVPLDRAPAVKTPYDESRDVIFYEPARDGFVMTAGQFTVFFPEDIHAPGLMAGSAAEVVKIVVKVAVG